MHLKRQEVPVSWPTYRKGTKYVIRPENAGLKDGVPLLLVLREMLKVAKNRKEAKRAIFLKHILVNNSVPRDDKKSVTLFDTVSLVPSKKSYRLGLSDKGKFLLSEIKDAEANKKVSKVVDKRILKNKKVQLNLQDGRNLLSTVDCKVNDSLLINFKEKKAEKCLPLKAGAKATVFSGKHSGKSGVIKSVDLEKKFVELEAHGEKLNILIKQIIITE